MQTTNRPTGLRTAARDYVTIVQQVKNKIKGFEQLYKEPKHSVNITGKEDSLS